MIGALNIDTWDEIPNGGFVGKCWVNFNAATRLHRALYLNRCVLMHELLHMQCIAMPQSNVMHMWEKLGSIPIIV